MESGEPNTSGSGIPPQEPTLQERISLLQRPIASATPPERALNQYSKLSAEDIADIAPGTWLNDRVMDTVLRRLTLLRPGKFFAVDLVSASMITGILDGLTEDEREVYTRPIKARVAMLTSTEGTVLMPFNLDGSHFVLVVIRPVERVIYIYDSSRPTDANNQIHPDYGPYLIEFVKNRVEWVFGFEPEDVSVIPPTFYGLGCPQQGNSVDCGVAVCLTALHIISHPECPTTYRRRPFTNSPGFSEKYVSDSYWLAGRKLILELCRPCANLSQEGVREALDSTEAAIEFSFAFLVGAHGLRSLEEQHYDTITQVIAGAQAMGACVDPTLLYSQQGVAHFATQAKEYRGWLTGPMLCINSDLFDLLNYVRKLGTASTIDRDLAIQRQAPNVVVSQAWMVHRAEVVRLAVSYAWHDVEEIRRTRDDLVRATESLVRVTTELFHGPGTPVTPLQTLLEDQW